MSRYRSIVGIHGEDGTSVSVHERVWPGRLKVRSLGRLGPEKGPEGSVCAMSLSGEQVFLRVLTVAPRPGVRPAEAVAEQISHFDESGEVETVRVLGRERRMCGRRAVLFALARSEVVEEAFRDAEIRSLNLVDLVPAPLALYNGAAAQLRTRDTLLCLRVGTESTDVFLGRGRVPLLARRMSVGIHAFSDTEPDGDAWKRWARELTSALAFARSLWPDRRAVPRTVVVCGERAWTAAERERIRSVAGAPCLDAADLPEARRQGAGSGFTPALGCALTSLGRAPISLSVFPAAAREQQVLRRQAPWWMAAAACAALGMALPVSRVHRSRVVHRRRVHQLRNRLERLSGLERDLLERQAENQALRRGMAPLRGAVHGADVVRRALQAVASAKDEEDWIILAADAGRYLAEGHAVTGRATGSTGTPVEHLVIEGYTPAHDLSTVRAMIERLRRYPFIAEADLLADDRLRQDPDRDRLWAPLGCRLFALEIRTVMP